MERPTIKVRGRHLIVREDTAKAYRFVRRGVIASGLCVAALLILFFVILFINRSG